MGSKRGWNFKRGAKDAPSVEELRARASKGGKARVPKGFSVTKKANPESAKEFNACREQRIRLMGEIRLCEWQLNHKGDD